MASEIDICNNALSLVGQGNFIKSLTDITSYEEQVCSTLYPQTLKSVLELQNWSFARRDELITKDYLLSEVISLPYKYTYKIPQDVMKILYITHDINNSDNEKYKAYHNYEDFNFRNYDNQKVLVTNAKYDFAIHYQAYVTETELFTPLFTEALEYYLSSRLAPTIIKSGQGIQIGALLFEQAINKINLASNSDSSQGAYSLTDNDIYPKSIISRF